MPRKDYYKILGLPHDASQDDIKRAYRILAHQFHPDTENGNEEKFKEVLEAYRILSDEGTRKEYDSRRESHHDNQSTKESYKPPIEEKSPWYKNGWVIFGAMVGVMVLLNSSSGNNNQKSQNANEDNFNNEQSIQAEQSTSNAADLEGISQAISTEQPKDVSSPQPKTGQQICVERLGLFATYNSEDNTCGCQYDYFVGKQSNKCIPFIEARDESCTAQYPNTSFLTKNASGTSICDCNNGYYWNNERTGCYSLLDFNNGCTNKYGKGSYSTTDYGKRVCDCSSGYSWNIERNLCISTSEIDAMCVRDVGRNSRYSGTVTDGKYNCTDPF